MRPIFSSTVLLLAALAPQITLAAPPAAETAVARMIPLEGAHNFRDAGGYRTADGRTVRWGKLFRSGTLGGITAKDIARLELLGVRSIVDLRSKAERDGGTPAWVKAPGRTYWALDYSLAGGTMPRNTHDRSTPEGAKAFMTDAYRVMVTMQAPGYRETFRQLIEGEGATIVNCSAGKDRTGIAVALVLTALGVPYATVREDFLLSNAAAKAQAGQREALAGSLSGQLPAGMSLLSGVHGEYLDAAFDQIRKDHGSVEGYLDNVLGIGADDIARLRRLMLV